MGCVKSYFKQAQSAGVSPSSTTDTANKGAGDSAVPSNDPSFINVSSEKLPEEPESGDTSYGVEATAVRKLAASTGTVAILGTTAQTALKEQGNEDDSDSPKETEDNSCISNDETQRINENSVEAIETSATPETEVIVAPSKERLINETQIPLITETLAPDLESSPDEQSCELAVDVDPPAQTGNDTAVKEEVTEGQSTPKPVSAVDETKSDSNETASAKTAHNDISSEQMKTNSLSDVSFSEFDDHTTNDESKVDTEKVEVVSKEASVERPEVTPEVTATATSIVQESVPTNTAHETSTVDTIESETKDNAEIAETSESKDDDGLTVAATKIQSTFRGYLVRKTAEASRFDDDGEDKLTDSQIESLKVEVDEIIREAEETTESIRNTPDEGEDKQVEEFPDPPDDVTLNEMINDDQNHSQLPGSSSGESSSNLNSDQKDLALVNNDSTSSDLEKLTADEDLPAPDTELLESSYTEDLNTEILNSVKAPEDDKSDAADLTIDEDSEVLKDIQKPQECDELNRGDIAGPSSEQNSAATLIQANIRGFLTRKQLDHAAGAQSNEVRPSGNEAGASPAENGALSIEELPENEGNSADAEANETSSAVATVNVVDVEVGNVSVDPVEAVSNASLPVLPQPEQIVLNGLPHIPNVPPTLAQLASGAVPRANINPRNPNNEVSNSPANGTHTGKVVKTEVDTSGTVNKLQAGDSIESTEQPLGDKSTKDLKESSSENVGEADVPKSDTIVEVQDVSGSNEDSAVEEHIENAHTNSGGTVMQNEITKKESSDKANDETKSINTEPNSVTPNVNSDDIQNESSRENQTQFILKPNLPLEEIEKSQTHVRQLKTPEVFVSQYEVEGSETAGDIPDFYDAHNNVTYNENGTKSTSESTSPNDESTTTSTDGPAKEASSAVNAEDAKQVEDNTVESKTEEIINKTEIVENSSDKSVMGTTTPSDDKSTPTEALNDSHSNTSSSHEKVDTDCIDNVGSHEGTTKHTEEENRTNTEAKKL